MSYNSSSQTLLLEDLLASKINHGSSRPCARKYCQDDRYPKLKLNISELILDSYEYIPMAYVRMHCMI